MADVTTETTTPTTSSCCSTDAQASSCEPAEKASSCGEPATADTGCGCSTDVSREAAKDTAASARRLELFEPAMCCETGVCGPSVDQQLIDARENLRWAESQGATVTRHNLSSDPDAFATNSKVTGLMTAFGDRALPALVVDGEIAVHGRYPSRDELAGVLGGMRAPQPVAIVSSTADGCGCGPGGC